MTEPVPVFMGTFEAIKASDVRDLYLDISADLGTGETIVSATFSVKNAAGAVQAGVVSNPSYTDTRADFRVTAPATVGTYTLTTVFTISDGQKITRTAHMLIV